MEQIGMRFIIMGRVQGVFFRDSTRKKAIELGITGWVKNIPEGHVECLAFGTADQLAQLESWLWEGPSQAQVSDVSAQSVPLERYESFDIQYHI
jgi:acylphosphatase